MSTMRKLKSILLTYSLAVFISINLLTIASGIALLTINNQVEAAATLPPPPPPPPPPTFNLDEKIISIPATSSKTKSSNVREIAIELGKEFDPYDMLNKNKKKIPDKKPQ